MDKVTMSLNLSRLKKTAVTNLCGKSGETKRCLVIPVDENDLVVNEYGVTLNLIAFPLDGKDSQTHLIKQNFKEEKRKAMTEDEKKSIPILGNIWKPKESLPKSDESYSVPQQYAGETSGNASSSQGSIDDLPF